MFASRPWTFPVKYYDAVTLFCCLLIIIYSFEENKSGKLSDILFSVVVCPSFLNDIASSIIYMPCKIIIIEHVIRSKT